jgi:hypothetical protein
MVDNFLLHDARTWLLKNKNRFKGKQEVYDFRVNIKTI